MNASEFLKATLLIYWDAAKLATRGLIRNWPLILGSICLFYIFAISRRIFGGMGFAGGMIAGMIQIAMLCYYYSWICSTVQKEKLRFRDLFQFEYGLFFNIISVAFIIFIAQFVLQHLTAGLDATFLILCVQLAIVFIFNAIPEIIYLQRIESTYALTEAAKFTRDNCIEWFLPFVVILLPWLMVDASTTLYYVANSEPLFPPFTLLVSFDLVDPLNLLFYIFKAIASADPRAVSLLGLLLQVVGFGLFAITVANWFMLFRGHLFQALSSGSRRQRIYKSKAR